MRKIKISLISLTSFLVFSAFLTPNSRSIGREDNALIEFLNEYLAVKYSDHDLREVLYVAVVRQKLYHVQNGELHAEYDISTSSKGVGSEIGSSKTPTGLHKISSKIGADVPMGGVFKNRIFNGDVIDLGSSGSDLGEDLITTRIMHLQGLESGSNQGYGVDSYERCIYIHGTHQEHLIGQPASHGCIRMRNQEVIELFNNVQVGTYVVILNN